MCGFGFDSLSPTNSDIKPSHYQVGYFNAPLTLRSVVILVKSIQLLPAAILLNIMLFIGSLTELTIQK